MKKTIASFCLLAVLASCNNGGNTADAKADSIEKRADTLTNKVDSAFDAKADSLSERKEELKDRIDSAAEARKDSLKGKTSNH